MGAEAKPEAQIFETESAPDDGQGFGGHRVAF
jgi:hypothetical protein